MGVLQGSTFNDTSLLQYYDVYNPKSYPGTGATLYECRLAPGPLGAILSTNVFPSTGYFNDNTGCGFKLNGSSDTIGINNTSAGGATITAEMWICYYGTSSGTIYQATYNAAGLGAGVYVGMVSDRSLQVGIFYSGSLTTTNSITAKLGIGTWHHIVITASSSNVIVYMDGEVAINTGATQYTTSPGSTTNYHGIGGSYIGYAPLKASYFKHYARVLSADEIKTNYEATKSRYTNTRRETILPGSTGYGVVQYRTDLISIQKTADSGLTWSNLAAGPFDNYGGSFSYNTYRGGYQVNKTWDETLSTATTDTSGGMRITKTDRGTLISRPFGSTLKRSTDNGATWTTVAVVGSIFSNGLHYGDGVCFFSTTDTNNNPRRVISLVSFDDGLTWKDMCTGLVRFNDNFGGASGYMNRLHHFWAPDGNLYVSHNGINWTNRGSCGLNLGGVYGDNATPFFRGGYYYASAGTQIYRSTDGVTWTGFGTAAPGNGINTFVGYINGNWVMATYSGNVGTIYTSSDATPTTWTSRFTSGDVGAVPYGAGACGVNQHGPTT